MSYLYTGRMMQDFPSIQRQSYHPTKKLPLSLLSSELGEGFQRAQASTPVQGVCL